jgi:hypothetical protein
MQSGFKNIKALTGQTVSDIAIQEYGSVNAIFKLSADNSVAIDSTFLPGQTIVIDTTYSAGSESFDESSVAVTPKRKSHVIALDNQNIFDICLQEYGTIEAVFAFMQANGITGLNTNLTANARYKLPVSATEQKHIREHFNAKQIKITTGKLAVMVGNYELREDGGYELREDGGYMILEN